MVEQIENVGGDSMPFGANKLPLSDEAQASLFAVRAAQLAARTRARRDTVRTRMWFGTTIGAMALGLVVFGPRVGRRIRTPTPVASASPRTADLPLTVALPVPPLSARAAESGPITAAPTALTQANNFADAPNAAPAEIPTKAPTPTAPAASAVAMVSAETLACTTTVGQPRWRVNAEACAKVFESRPNDAALALTIAHAHHAKGHLAQAGEWARRTIALNSHSAEAFVILARAENHAGRPAAAAQAYRSYLDLAPRGWHASEARAALHRSDEHARRTHHGESLASDPERG